MKLGVKETLGREIARTEAFFGGGNKPPSHQLGALGSAISSPVGSGQKCPSQK